MDKAVILRKLSELETYQNQIREYSGITAEDYKKDWKTRRIVERTLQILIECCADIANHIIADGNMRSPTGYSDTFRVLTENQVTGQDLGAIMEKMSKFRNVVVHQYEEVDVEIVIVILRKHLQDFDRFKQAILTYLKNFSQ
ncbi:MAG: DUF86 domain-containing protein [Nitrospirae bacterium]|nr:DUF86 domain-containing protein [Nitrospirota bacterium]